MRAEVADCFSRLLLLFSSRLIIRRCPNHHHYKRPVPPSNYYPVLLTAPLSSSSSSSSSINRTDQIPEDASSVFLRWGCSEAEVSKIRHRHPSLLRMNPLSLHSKLQILRSLGILGPDLIKILTCRPRLLACRFGHDLDRRLHFLRTLFPSDASLLRRAILRNPSLLNYDVDHVLIPCVQLYEGMGIGRYDLGRLLISRPTVISRSSIDEEKLDIIRRTRLPPHATMYKYAVSIIAISRLETIRRKVANFEKFGFTVDEVMGLFARTPNVLTLSVDKVQRNMTYIMGIMKLPASAALEEPLLLYANLDTVLKPRHMLGVKLQEMGLQPQIKGSSLFTAMRMKEPRFLKAFVLCHKEDDDVVQALMDFYTSVKGARRLAESSRKVVHKGFPF